MLTRKIIELTFRMTFQKPRSGSVLLGSFSDLETHTSELLLYDNNGVSIESTS
jgi:hypothetical protein